MTTFEKKAEQARNEADRIETLGSIYNTLYDSFKWNFCCTGDKDENGEYIFKEMEKPEDDNLWDMQAYKKMLVWKEVLKAIEKMA